MSAKSPVHSQTRSIPEDQDSDLNKAVYVRKKKEKLDEKYIKNMGWPK